MISLRDLGERTILSSILPRYTVSQGNDCEVVDIDKGSLVITTDPVPAPAAHLIAGSRDPYYTGWLLVTINASDIAAAGAAPIGIMVAAEFPATDAIHDFERFLEGIRDACSAEDCAYLGGNLREASKFSATATAVGWRSSQMRLGRRGARCGDVIVSIGQGGIFWRDAFRVWGGGTVEVESPIFTPLSQGATTRALAQRGLLNAAMDVSDGLLPTLQELGQKNGLATQIYLRALTVPEVEERAPIPPWKLWLGWGDWTVIGAVSPNRLDEAIAVGRDSGHVVIPIGEFVEGDGEVLLASDYGVRIAARLESERFAPDSWFEGGIEAYGHRLRSFPDAECETKHMGA